ncbi:phosphoglycerate mutase 1 [Camelus ferus]|nr:phosphoglycerate mutase 1 [Camelus ferus]
MATCRLVLIWHTALGTWKLLQWVVQCRSELGRACAGSERCYEFDICYTSVQKRTIRTLWKMLDAIDQMWPPMVRTWHLNERHYRGLTGLSKAETAAMQSKALVKIWRGFFKVALSPVEPSYSFHSNSSEDCRPH